MKWIIQYHDRMPPHSIADSQESLTGQASKRLGATASTLVKSLPGKRPLIIGIAGAPGTGKSTLARHCAALLDDSLVLSLDDYYLPRAQRHRLAETIHPLLGMRGVPGTHDIALLSKHLAQLKNPSHVRIEVPVFDKQSDDRVEPGRVIPEGTSPQFIFVEGWIIGVPPQQVQELQSPVNSLETERDPHARWRTWVNAALSAYAGELGPHLDLRWFLQAPDWETVIGWRWDQERQLERPWLSSREDVAEFLAPFQRLCMHIQHHGHAWADRVITLDQDHKPVNLAGS